MKTFLKSSILLFAFLISMTQWGCQKDARLAPPGDNPNSTNVALKDGLHGSDLFIATTWIDRELRLEKSTTGWTSLALARAFGYTGITMYESMVYGMPGHVSLVGQLSDLTSLPLPDASATYSWPLVCNAALAQIIRSLFANASAANKASIDSLENANNAQFTLGTAVFDRSVAYGVTLANAIFEWSKTDGGDKSYDNVFPGSYVTPVGDGYWKPFGTQGPIPVLPYWGNNRPFVTGDIASSLPVPPRPFSADPNSQCYKQNRGVYHISRHLTPEQSNIALWWNDGAGTYTSVGHSFNLLRQTLEETNSTLRFAAKASARLGMAINDAMISCWTTKFTYTNERPVTYIRTYIDPNWLPLIPTPAFPEYVSEHSSQSGAMAEVMGSIFGKNYSFTDYTHVDLGFPARSFPSFQAAADEASISKWYGGIHYLPAGDQGLATGKIVAQAILNLNM